MPLILRIMAVFIRMYGLCKISVAITDAIEADKVAGGGVFVHYDNISEESADIFINTRDKEFR